MPDDQLQALWAGLPFTGFDFARDDKRQQWEAAAQKIVSSPDNIALVADTAAGKTVIACLAIFALGKRTLFLVPQRLLASQHQELFSKIIGDDNFRTRVITGATPAKQRIWDDVLDRVVFATPHVFLSGLRSNIADLGSFGLVLLDEIHNASGNYQYVEVAILARSSGTRLIGLTASPGKNLDRIQTLASTCFLDQIIRAEIPTPKKREDIVYAEPSEILLSIEADIVGMIEGAIKSLKKLHVEFEEGKIPTISELDEAQHRIEGWPRDWRFFQAISTVARIYKLRRALVTALTESYDTFIKYAGRIATAEHNQAAATIRVNTSWIRSVQLALVHSDGHPKVLRMIELAKSFKEWNKNALVFFSNKELLKELQLRLFGLGIRVNIVMGSKDKNIKSQQRVLDKLRNREVDLVLATSVLQEGVSIPEVDTVVHYNVPQTEIARIQRSGRTGRMHPGNVIYLLLNHSIDKIPYWVTRSGEKTMKKTLARDGFTDIIVNKSQRIIGPSLPLFDSLDDDQIF